MPSLPQRGAQDPKTIVKNFKEMITETFSLPAVAQGGVPWDTDVSASVKVLLQLCGSLMSLLNQKPSLGN